MSLKIISILYVLCVQILVFGSEYENTERRNDRFAGQDHTLCEDRFEGLLNNGSCQLMNTKNAPRARQNEILIWTGKEMLVWGGQVVDEKGKWTWSKTGGIFNLETLSWRSINVESAPETKDRQLAIYQSGKFYLKNLDQTEVFCYDLGTDIWNKCNDFKFPEPDTKLAIDDGTRNGPFNYNYDHHLIPLKEGKPRRGTPPMEVHELLSSLSRNKRPRFGEWEMIGNFKDGASLYGQAKSLISILGLLSDDSWVILTSPIDSYANTRHEDREFRLIWTGKELLAWGGSQLEKDSYVCPCGEGRPCGGMPRSCLAVQRVFYNDGLIYTPNLEQWKCSLRVSSPDAGILGLRMIEKMQLPDKEKLKVDGNNELVLKAQKLRSIIVNQIEKESAAEKAGFVINDELKELNGAEVKTAAEFSNQISNLKKGTKIKVGILRNGKQKVMTVTLDGRRRTIPANCQL